MTAIRDLLLGDRRDPRDVLARVFGERSASVAPAARDWALTELGKAGIDAKSEPVAAIRRLGQAEPRLGLKTATYLVRNL